MAEENNQQQQVKGCTGDCKLCTMMQRGYCSSQIGFNNMKLIASLVQEVNDMKAELKAMTEEIAASYPKPEQLINPASEE